jgi:hypothetical protein
MGGNPLPGGARPRRVAPDPAGGRPGPDGAGPLRACSGGCGGAGAAVPQEKAPPQAPPPPPQPPAGCSGCGEAGTALPQETADAVRARPIRASLSTGHGTAAEAAEALLAECAAREGDRLDRRVQGFDAAFAGSSAGSVFHQYLTSI